DRMTPDQLKGYRSMIDGPRGRLPGPFKGWGHNPKLLQAAAPLGEHFTPGQSSLSEREREIAVVVITNRWRSAYPAAAHERRAKEVGPWPTFRPRSATRASRWCTKSRRRSPAVGWSLRACTTGRSRCSGTRVSPT